MFLPRLLRWLLSVLLCSVMCVCAQAHEYMQVPEFLCMSGHVKKVKTLTENVVSIIDKCSVDIPRCPWNKYLLLYRMERETKPEVLFLGINSREIKRFTEKNCMKCLEYYSL